MKIIVLMIAVMFAFSGCITEEQEITESNYLDSVRIDGKLYYKNGQVVFDKINDFSIEYYENGNIKDKYNYLKYLSFYESGAKKSEINYNIVELNGREGRAKEGKSFLWYENGSLEFVGNYIIETWNLNKYYGDWGSTGNEIYYYENGQIKKQGNILRDKKNDLWVEFFEDGSIKTKTNYNQRELHGFYLNYYESGQIKKQGTYWNNEKESVWSEFFEDGTVKSEINYHLGDLNGTYFTIYDTKEKKEEGTYKLGKKQGLWTQWYPNGQIEHSAIYDNGTPIKNIEWYAENGEIIYKSQ